MTYQTQVLATRAADLEGLWMLSETAGATSAVDLGPNNVALAYSAAKVDGAELISGAGPGMAGSIYASAAVASGSALAPTAKITLAAWYSATSWPGASAAIAGRQNHARLFVHSGGHPGVTVWGTATNDFRATNRASLNTAYFFVATYDGEYLRHYINGVLVQEMQRTSALAAVSDVFMVGSNGTQIAGTIQGVAVWSAALDAGEINELFRAGTKVAVLETVLAIDNQYVTPGSTYGARCAGCTGRRKVNEPTVVKDGRSWHPGCYLATGQNKPATLITSSSTPAEIEAVVLRAIDTCLGMQATRITDWAKPVVFDGTKLAPTTPSGYDLWIGQAVGAAVVARHRNLPTVDKTVQLAIQQVERAWALQDSTGKLVEGAFSDGGDFVLPLLGEAVLYLRPHVTQATYDRWVINLVKLATYFQTQPPARPEWTWTVNGNREAFELWGYWMVYKVTGSATWKAAYDRQLLFVQDPGAVLAGTQYAALDQGFADLDGIKTFGLAVSVAPTQADGSDGKGYLIERASSYRSDILADGYDPYYTALGLSGLTRLWLHNQDPQVLRMINLSWNMVADRVNFTSGTVGDVPSWVLDGRDGSRRKTLVTGSNPAILALAIKGGYSRANLTTTIVAGAVNEAIRYCVETANSTGLNRWLNLNLVSLLMTLPSWPGDPV